MTLMQRAIALFYPDQCAYCTAFVGPDGGLCSDCWRETDFVVGHTCDHCDAPLLGDADGHADICDACVRTPRPWSHGRAAFYYGGVGRKLVLALKYGDRTDLVSPAARWMAQRASGILTPKSVFVPVPAHWRRLLARRYNPAVELARALAAETGLAAVPDALLRTRATPTQEGLDVDARFQNVQGAIAPTPAKENRLAGKPVVLVDDTMTTGATLSAAAEAVLQAGAAEVSVVVLARAVQTP